MSHLRLNSVSFEGPIFRFREQTEELSGYFARNGVNKVPYFSPALTDFRKLNAHEQKSAVQTLGHTLDVFAESELEGADLRDTPQLLWRSLRRLGWTPKSDVFDQIHEDDAVEIYSADHIGLFRNLRCYELLSYSIEQLFSKTWYELVRRDSKITEQLYEAARKFIEGEVRETSDPNIEEHVCFETHSPELLSVWIRFKLFSPLYANGRFAGLLVTHESKIVQN